MQNFQMVDLTPPIAVVAHDAGAANLIKGWLEDFHNLDVRFCVDGPAKDIFRKAFPQFENLTMDGVLYDASTLLSGTSGETDLEYLARKEAQKKGITSIGVVDHWVNYNKRFKRNGKIVLPNEIWVTDNYALNMALQCFPSKIVKKMPNRYLQQVVESIYKKTDRSKKNQIIHVLYVLEPIHLDWNNSDIAGEYQALNYFIQHLDFIGDENQIEIRLRAHPSEKDGKYNDWCKKNEHLNIVLDTENDLSDLIAWSDWVVGCETFSMVIALHANRKILSSLPPWAPLCKLPHEGIIQLRDLEK